jgi:ribose transport system permease protein
MMPLTAKLPNERKRWRPRLGHHRGLVVAVLVLLAVFAALDRSLAQPFGYADLSSAAGSTASLALAAMGETVVIIAGGLDLSAGATLSLSNCLFVTHAGTSVTSILAWIVLAVAAGGLVGAVNGYFVAYLRLQPVAVTLATMFMTQGLTLLVMKQPGGSVSQDFSSGLTGDVFGGRVPAPLLVIVLGLAVWALIKRTRFGTGLYAVGSDEASAWLRGLPTRAIKFWSYVVAGCFYAAAGVFLSAQTGAGDPLVGAGMLLPVFVAVVLGGTALGGGRGGALGTMVGAFTVTLIGNMLLVLNVSTYYSTVVEGAILLLAVIGSSGFPNLAGVTRGLFRRPFPRQQPVLPQRSAARATLAEGPKEARTPRHWLARHRELLSLCLPAYAGLIVMVAVTMVAFDAGMRVSSYLQSLIVLSSFLAVLALGQGAVVVSGGLDLSVPFTITFCGVVLTGVTNGSDMAALWAIPMVVAMGGAIGAVNGIGAAVFRIPPLIMTLAMNGILQGAALVFTNGAPTGFAPDSVRWLMTGKLWGVKPVVFGLVLFVAAAVYLLHFTVYSRRLFAVGSNPLAAEFSGVPVRRVVIATYALSGVCSALVGIMLAGFTGQAFNDMGDPYLLTSIAVVVVGGTLMTGGRGHYAGMFGGALMLTALSTLLSGSTLPAAARSIVYGAVVLAAVIAMRERRVT